MNTEGFFADELFGRVAVLLQGVDNRLFADEVGREGGGGSHGGYLTVDRSLNGPDLLAPSHTDTY